MRLRATQLVACALAAVLVATFLHAQRAVEWFGPDCSLRRCPSGDNPMTRADETNCTNVTAAGGYGVGRAGNLCHVDCADRGSCDHETGECNCWTGAYGHDCTLSSALAM